MKFKKGQMVIMKDEVFSRTCIGQKGAIFDIDDMRIKVFCMTGKGAGSMQSIRKTDAENGGLELVEWEKK